MKTSVCKMRLLLKVERHVRPMKNLFFNQVLLGENEIKGIQWKKGMQNKRGRSFENESALPFSTD